MLFCLPVMQLSGLAFVLMAVQTAPPAASQDLARMVAAERAFAAATKEIGVRDGFLTFLTDDAIDVAPVGGGLALIRLTDRLRAQPQPALPLTRQLLWEPRWGAIAGAGDLGWLTGPYTMHDTTGAVLHAEVSASGDLGFTAGSYDAAAKASEGRPESSERGFFVRVWHRDDAGAWNIAFETNGIR